MRWYLGQRIQAIKKITSPADPSYQIEAGEHGTLVSLYADGRAISLDDMGVVWDNFPGTKIDRRGNATGIINSIHEADIAPSDA